MNKQIKQRIAQLNNGEIPNGYKKTEFGVFPGDWITDKKLKDLGVFGKGKGIPGDKMQSEGVPCVGYGDIYMKYNHFHFEKALSFVDKETAKDSQLIKKGTLLFTGTGETADEIGKCVCYNGEEDIYAGGDIVTFVSDEVNPLFLAYQQYQSFSLRKKASFGQGHSVVHIQKENLEKLDVAYPPSLQEQAKIAEILMKWDEAIELMDLYKDLLLKKKKYFLSVLLLPKKDWCVSTFGETGDIYQPQTISENEMTPNGYSVYGANGLIGYYSKYNHEDSQVAITCRGSTCGVVTFTAPYSWITGNAMVFSPNEKVMIKKFAYYSCLNRSFNNVISGSGQPQITRQALKMQKIYYPSMKMQQKTVDLLDSLSLQIELVNKKSDRIKTQRKALQQYLLNGIVRV